MNARVTHNLHFTPTSATRQIAECVPESDGVSSSKLREAVEKILRQIPKKIPKKIPEETFEKIPPVDATTDTDTGMLSVRAMKSCSRQR